MDKVSGLEVFQDLEIAGPESKIPNLRDALSARAHGPWVRDEEKEKQHKQMGGGEDEVLIFVREPMKDIVKSALFLWQQDGGYKVTNIVPSVSGELGTRRYNTLLQDFVAQVAKSASDEVGFSLSVSSSIQRLEDWVSEDVAVALKVFSSNANKSTGSSHPFDRDRWFKFLLLVHANPGELDTNLLARWLIEVEGWPEDKAEDLVIQYEFALNLLDYAQ